MSYMHTVLTLVKGMTVAVNQPIPLDTSKVEAWGFVHLRIAVIPYIMSQLRKKVV